MAFLLVMLLVFHLIGALMFIPPMVSLLRPRFAIRYAEERQPHSRRGGRGGRCHGGPGGRCGALRRRPAERPPIPLDPSFFDYQTLNRFGK